MRVSDLLPTQWGVYAFLFLLGIGCILGLGYACWTQPGLAILNPTQPGNMAAWFSSVLWFFSALVCLTAFQLDRYTHSHRLSDIWLWAVFGCFLLSVDSACQVRDFLRDVLVQVSGTALYGNGDVWWISFYVILFGMIGSRLLVEMRHHLLSCNLFFVAVLSQILACCIALHLFELPGQETRLPVLLRSGLEMLGAFFAVFSFSLFARNMVLQLDFPKQAPEQKITVPKASKKVKEKKEEKAKPIEVKPEKKNKSKRPDPSRTCPIVFPAQGGEKIVKVEEIEPINDEESVEKLKKRRKKSPPPSQPFEEEELEEYDDFVEEEYDDIPLEEEEEGEEEEYEYDFHEEE